MTRARAVELGGKHLLHSRLAMRSNGEPGIKIFPTCKNLVRTLPAFPYSRWHPEDVDTTPRIIVTIPSDSNVRLLKANETP